MPLVMTEIDLYHLAINKPIVLPTEPGFKLTEANIKKLSTNHFEWFDPDGLDPDEINDMFMSGSDSIIRINDEGTVGYATTDETTYQFLVL